MQMQMMHPMQQMQPRLVLQQAVLKQPAVLSHARPAQPWLGQVHQLGQLNPARPMAMPVAMRTPIVKAVVKPVARPLRWVYAAPMQRNQINQGRTNQVVLACQELVSTKVMAPELKELPKELPKEAGCVGDAPSTFKFFGNLASSGFVKSQNDQNVNLFIFVPVGFASHAKQVVSMQVKPRRKELPLIEGQVPKDAGVEGMHPIDFKAFWEQSLFKFFSRFVKYIISSFVPVAFAASLQALGSKRFSHDLSCYFTPWEVQYVWHWFCIILHWFYMFWFHKIYKSK